LFLSLTVSFTLHPASAAPETKPLRVVTTTPDLAWFVEEIGGDRVDVSSLAQGKENLHALKVTPRTIVAVAKADLLFENGLSLESTWLPDLILASRNKGLSFESGGRVNASEGWAPIELPSTLSREEGDVHPGGNPHFAISPEAGSFLADRVLAGLLAKDPADTKLFEANHTSLQARIAKAHQRWERYKPLFAHQRVVMYHLEFDYLADFLGLEILASIEPKPGLPPTPSHLAKVIELMGTDNVPPILVATWSNNRQAKAIAEKTGATLLELPSMVHGEPYATGWVEMIDGMLEAVRVAYGLPELAPEEEAPGQ